MQYEYVYLCPTFGQVAVTPSHQRLQYPKKYPNTIYLYGWAPGGVHGPPVRNLQIRSQRTRARPIMCQHFQCLSKTLTLSPMHLSLHYYLTVLAWSSWLPTFCGCRYLLALSCCLPISTNCPLIVLCARQHPLMAANCLMIVRELSANCLLVAC